MANQTSFAPWVTRQVPLAGELNGWGLLNILQPPTWIGIPLAVSSILLLFLTDWYWAAGAFFFGYLLQWIGHQAEGNDLGEWAAIKRLFGLPYVGISPRWNPTDPDRL